MIKRIDSHLFTLKVKLGQGRVAIIRAHEGPATRGNQTHTMVDLELRYEGKTLFPLGVIYIGIPGHRSIDGDYTRAAALRAFALKPGDTDREFFDGYTTEQLEFVTHYGEAISMEADRRFGEGV
jgi:hypothetical protein